MKLGGRAAATLHFGEGLHGKRHMPSVLVRRAYPDVRSGRVVTRLGTAIENPFRSVSAPEILDHLIVCGTILVFPPDVIHIGITLLDKHTTERCEGVFVCGVVDGHPYARHAAVDFAQVKKGRPRVFVRHFQGFCPGDVMDLLDLGQGPVIDTGGPYEDRTAEAYIAGAQRGLGR